jgi:hypothetical protein
MRATGPASLTDRSRLANRVDCPGLVPGRSALAFISLILILCCAVPSSAQEVFSWFNRGLLPVDFTEGDWVSYAIEEVDEYGAVRDTLTVTVVEVDSSRVWLRLESPNTVDYVALDPERVSPGAEMLEAIVRVVHDTDAGLVEEDLEEMRGSALAQRHFSDPFRDPEIRRRALADSLVGGHPLTREAVELVELRREAVGAYVVVTDLFARAQLSPEVPLLGLVSSWTLSEVTTEAAEGGRSRRRPPLVNETALTCLDFGRGTEARLPEGLFPGN